MAKFSKFIEAAKRAGLTLPKHPNHMPRESVERLVYDCAPHGRKVDALCLVKDKTIDEQTVKAAFSLGGAEALKGLIDTMLEFGRVDV